MQELLKSAGVSRTAYYSLVRKETVLPKSVNRIALRLGVNPGEFLDGIPAGIRKIRALEARAGRIQRRHPECDPDVVMRTLKNLELPPVERLRRALVRAQTPDIRG